jgi:hypothetical protein
MHQAPSSPPWLAASLILPTEASAATSRHPAAGSASPLLSSSRPVFARQTESH